MFRCQKLDNLKTVSANDSINIHIFIDYSEKQNVIATVKAAITITLIIFHILFLRIINNPLFASIIQYHLIKEIRIFRKKKKESAKNTVKFTLDTDEIIERFLVTQPFVKTRPFHQKAINRRFYNPKRFFLSFQKQGFPD